MKLISTNFPGTPISFDISLQQGYGIHKDPVGIVCSLSLLSQISGFIQTLDISVSVSMRKTRNITHVNKTNTLRTLRLETGF